MLGGTWVALMADVTDVRIQVEVLDTGGESYFIDLVVLSAAPPVYGDAVTLLYEPPSGPANAVILTDATCGGIQTALDACEAELGGAVPTCIDDGDLAIGADRIHHPLAVPRAG